MERYTQELEILKSRRRGAANSDSPNEGAAISESQFIFGESEFAAPVSPEIERLKQEYYLIRKKYIKAYDDLLDAAKNPAIDLSKSENTEIIIQSLRFWEGQKLRCIAFTIMPNHVHWVVELFELDQKGKPVYLQDVLQSVKRFSSNQVYRLIFYRKYRVDERFTGKPTVHLDTSSYLLKIQN